MSGPEILMPAPMRDIIAQSLEPQFTIHKTYEAADPEAALSALKDNVRGMVVTGTKIDKAFIDRFPHLEIISNFGVGYDNIDAAYCGTKGIVVTNTPDVLSEEVADTALGLLLMTARELPSAEHWLRSGNWAKNGSYRLTPGTLRGRKVGVLGLGRIGKAIASRCEAFGMEIHYHGRHRQNDVSYAYHDTLKGMAQAVDTLMIVAPGTPTTYHIVNQEILAALGPSGIVVNVGRGSVIDTDDLIKALSDGVILSAGLDVFENEPNVPEALLALDNAVLLPHVGSGSARTRDAMGQLVADNIKGWFTSRSPVTPVPETPVK